MLQLGWNSRVQLLIGFQGPEKLNDLSEIFDSLGHYYVLLTDIPYPESLRVYTRSEKYFGTWNCSSIGVWTESGEPTLVLDSSIDQQLPQRQLCRQTANLFPLAAIQGISLSLRWPSHQVQPFVLPQTRIQKNNLVKGRSLQYDATCFDLSKFLKYQVDSPLRYKYKNQFKNLDYHLELCIQFYLIQIIELILYS